MDYRQILEKNAKGDNGDSVVETEEPITSEYYATDRIKGPLMCLDLRLADGKRKALPYSFVTGLTYDNEAGIEIITTHEKIIITGRNLTKLYENLIVYRVRYVQANLGGDGQEDGLFVGEILVHDVDM